MLMGSWTKSTYFSRNVVFAALVLIGAIAVYNWFVVPHTGYLRAAQRYETVAEELIKTNRLVSSDVAAKKKELKALAAKLAKGRTKLFEPADAGKFFGSIQGIAKESHCAVLSLKFLQTGASSKQKESGAAGDVAIEYASLSVVGTYKDIVTLMNKLQNRTQQVWIDGVSIKLARDDISRLKCDMTIMVCVLASGEVSTYGGMGDKEKLPNG